MELGIRSYAAVTEAGRRKRQRCRSKPKALGDLGGVVKLEIYGWICNGYAMDMQWIWMFCFSPLFFPMFRCLIDAHDVCFFLIYFLSF